MIGTPTTANTRAMTPPKVRPVSICSAVMFGFCAAA
jgi:hypothetical protein